MVYHYFDGFRGNLAPGNFDESGACKSDDSVRAIMLDGLLLYHNSGMFTLLGGR